MNCNRFLSSLKSICIIVILYNIVKDGILKFAQRDNCCIIIIKYIFFITEQSIRFRLRGPLTIHGPGQLDMGRMF